VTRRVVQIPIAKLDAPSRRVFGWTDQMDVAALEPQVHALIKSQPLGCDTGGGGRIIESLVIDSTKARALNFPQSAVGKWWVGVHYCRETDPEWQEIKAGRTRMFKIRGLRHQVGKGDNPLAKIVLTKRHGDADGFMEREEIDLSKTDDPAAVLEELCKSIEAEYPDLTPAEVWRRAAESAHGQAIMERNRERYGERTNSVQKDQTRDVQRVSERADEIRKEAAAMGEPITEARAYAKAMAERKKAEREVDRLGY
jgi:hypothetical protein